MRPGRQVVEDAEVGTVYQFGGPRAMPWVCEGCDAYLLIDHDAAAAESVAQCPVCGCYAMTSLDYEGW